MKKNLLILGLLLAILSQGVLGDTSFAGLEPEDNFDTSDTTPEFCVTPITNVSSITTGILYIGGVPYGTKTTPVNNTQFCITANATLTRDAHTWYFNVTDAETENMSASRTIDISYFGGTIQTIEDVLVIFAPILAIVVAVVPVFVALLILIFLMGVLDSVYKSVRKKV